MSSRELRKKLVDELRKNKAINSEAVAKVFLSVPRERFVPEHVRESGLEGVYKDVALPTKQDSRGAPISSSSQPAIMAAMLEELRLEPGLRVLEIGAGTGYNAALLSRVVGPKGRVTTLDIEHDIVRRARNALKAGNHPVKTVLGDGREGWAAGAPYDRIIATASSLEVPKPWFDQLKEGGFLTMPLRVSDRVFWPQIVVTFTRRGNSLQSVSVVPGGFMGMRSAGGVSSQPSSVYLGAMTKKHRESFGSLVGPTLDKLSKKTLRSLARNLAGDTKIFPLPKPENRYDLQLLLALAAHPDNLVSISLSRVNSDIGAVDVDGEWFLKLAGRGRRCDAVEIMGRATPAKTFWLDIMKQWKTLGQPKHKSLSIAVTTEKQRGAWKSIQRGDLWLNFAWPTAIG